MNALALPGQLTETGLVLPDKMPLADWAALGPKLGGLGRAMPWALGDWLCHGENHYGELAAQYSDLPGYAPQTLLNLASVARHVGFGVRRADLSWSHHAEVMGEPPARQVELLERAAKSGWSSKQLREEIRGTGPARPSLGEVGDALCSATLAILRDTGAGSELLRDAAWQAVDHWLERRGKEPSRR